MPTDPLVHVLIINWNGRHHLEICLPSLLATRYPRFEAVLIDNGSSDGSVEWARREFPQVSWVGLGANQGFAGAANVGLRRAVATGARYAVLLNNDTRLDCNWLGALVDAAESDPLAAICQARQRTWDGQHEIRFRFIPEWAEADQTRAPIGTSGEVSPTPFASGCAMLVRCDSLRSIGLLDDRYHMYVEDVDISLRAWISGHRVLDVPEAIVYHRMTGSSSRVSQRMYWGYRNQLTTLIKLYQPLTLKRYVRPISRRWFVTRNRIALQGTAAALAWLPGTLTRRGQVQRNRRCGDTAFLELCDE